MARAAKGATERERLPGRRLPRAGSQVGDGEGARSQDGEGAQTGKGTRHRRAHGAGARARCVGVRVRVLMCVRRARACAHDVGGEEDGELPPHVSAIVEHLHA